MICPLTKCLCSTVRASAREFFEPLQVGVGCPLGLEAAIHTMARYRDRHSGSSQKVILTIDFQNAFNTMSRSAFLRACRQQMPAVSAWASWCYASPSRLIHNKEVILSQAGVQQGDNLGPLLFSLAIHPVLEQLKVVPGVDVVIGYLDDVVVAGDAPAVLAAFRLLQAAMPDFTLALNATKCELIPTAGADSAADLSDFPSDMKRSAMDASNSSGHQSARKSSQQGSQRRNERIKRTDCSTKSHGSKKGNSRTN